MKNSWLWSIPFLLSSPALSQGLFAACPTSDDLDYGIVFTTPATWGLMKQRYRRLEGDYIGENFIGGVFPDRTNISFAGLFTYKAWRDGELVQHEEPKTDLKGLTNFEPRTEYGFESVRSNHRDPSRKWLISAKYKIEKTEDISIGGCNYSAIIIRRNGKISYPDGRIKDVRENYLFVPELTLRVSSKHSPDHGLVSSVRKRSIFDQRRWPFVIDAANVLDD